MIKTKLIVLQFARKENSQLILMVGQRTRPHATSVVSAWETGVSLEGATEFKLDSRLRSRISDSF